MGMIVLPEMVINFPAPPQSPMRATIRLMSTAKLFVRCF